jgi:glutamine amidotransferase
VRATIFDYGAGNLHSLAKALVWAGAEVAIEPDPGKAVDTDLLVLPGVGAFTAAIGRLGAGRETMRLAITRGLPCLGICLGMQLLFDASEEGPGTGLGLIPGPVTRIAARRVPHMGWNRLEQARDAALEEAGLETAYFAHSFACRPERDDCVVAWCAHEGDRFAAAVRSGSMLGVQFHPEKSSRPGLELLRAFVEESRCARRESRP